MEGSVMKEVWTIQERTGKQAKEGKENKDIWTKIGSAFENKDGSMNVYLNALPMNGKLQIRERKEKDE
jgi:hypothetical protein